MRFKEAFVNMEREVQSRTIGAAVHFHAVLCEMYRRLCRTYGITGYPVVLGYPVSSGVYLPLKRKMEWGGGVPGGSK